MKTFSKITAALTALILVSCGTDSSLTLSGLDPADFAGEYDGSPTALYVMTNENGMEVAVTNFGGRLVSVMVPDREGNMRDVILGFDKVSDYFPENNQTDFGASIGRYANRIADGRFTLDGKEYDLPKNNFGHCLHGGPGGWQYKVYETLEADSHHVKLRLVSPDGDNGFPGTVTATVTYTLTDENAIDISYEAVTDAPTIINMTNHAYFNLSGDPTRSIEDHFLTLNAPDFTPVDSTFMTSGRISGVEGTPFDFLSPKRIGQEIEPDGYMTEFAAGQLRNAHGYDHNWVLASGAPFAAELYCPESGIDLKVTTTEPGIQVYSGNFLDGSVSGKKGIRYGHRAAVCLETQKFPDSPNKPSWPSPVLRPGETYASRCTYSFSTK